MLRDVNDQWLLFPVILMLVMLVCMFVCVCFPCFVFAGMELLISCIVLDVVILIGLDFSLYYFVYVWMCGKILFKFRFVLKYLVFSIYGD